MFTTGNPALRESAFQAPQRWADLDAAERKLNVMTLQGTINKTSMMLGVCALFAVLTWNYAPQLAAQFGISPIVILFGSAIVGLVAGLVIAFNPKAAPVMAFPYAIVEGVFVGSASLLYAAWVGSMDTNQGGTLSTLAGAGSSIVLQAGVLTFSITAAMLIAYSTRLIRMSATAVKGIAIATGGAVLFVGVWWIMSFFMAGIDGPYAITPLGIGIAAVMVVLASVNLLADFWIIEEGVKTEQPKWMEWYGGFALLVTIVWLYVSLLRLLAMLRAQE